MGGSEGVGVTERGAERESTGCGVEHGVLVGVGVDGLGVPDPKAGKWTKTDKTIKIERGTFWHMTQFDKEELSMTKFKRRLIF